MNSNGNRGRAIAGLLRVGIGLGIASVLIASAIPFLSNYVSGAPARTPDVEICDRTVKVRDAIVAASGVSECAQVTDTHVRDITSLDLSGQGITSLSVGDFGGLHRLDTLDLSGNSLASLPEGLFDELYLLRVLRLNDNRLSTLPVSIFDQLFLLEKLKLTGNTLTTLPQGMFDDFSRFKGALTGQEVSGMARLRQFLAEHDPETPEEFIGALPDLHKQHFAFVYSSQGLGAEFVSSEFPRAIVWGADAEFVLAWQTNPNATDALTDSIEFLIHGNSKWSAGIIDFSGDEPAINHPASCQACHGAINKPLWGTYYWVGAENRPVQPLTNTSAWSQAMESLFDSTDERISHLDFSKSMFGGGSNTPFFPRWRKPAPSNPPYLFPEEELAVMLTMRHAEVLFSRLKAQESYAHFAQATVCANNPATSSLVPFQNNMDHNLGRIGNTRNKVGGPKATSRTTDYEHRVGTVGDAVVFLMLHDYWQSRAEVRRLYRGTPNGDVPQPGGAAVKDDYLLYPAGSASAEDELIQLYRLLFGHGNGKSLNILNEEHAGKHDTGLYTADLGYGHTLTMAPKVCRFLRDEQLNETRPHNLTAAVGDGQALIDWSPPTKLTGITGYRVKRGANSDTLSALVADTGSTATSYTDTSVTAGADYVYTVTPLIGSEVGNESPHLSVQMPAAPSSPTISSTGSFTVLEGETAAGTLTAEDDDTEAANLTWSVTGGADKGHFTLGSGGALNFTGPKDFESPDDADADGVYEATVQVSDGERTDTADVTVTLTNRNEAPTADAGEDQTDVEEGAVVTLSGTGTDPDSDDTLTYGWSQTGGTTVTLSTTTATTTFTAPSGLTRDETLAFALRVTDAGGLYGDDSVEVTVSPPLTARFEDMPDSHVGSNSFTFKLRFSETPKSDFSYRTLRDHAFTVTGGEVVKARRLEPGKNVRWEITVEPSGNGAVTVSLPATTDCDNQGAICTGDGRKLSRALEVTVPVQNSPATGAPTISGTAQVGQTLTVGTSGISDSDGLTSATFAYQWLADATDISGATNSAYTLVDSDEGKAITVTVTFTDDRGNAESVTSTATSAVSARPNTPATGAPTISGTVQVGQILTASTSGIVDADGLANATFAYQWLADATDISGATSSTYTLTTGEQGKAITVTVTFTDDAGNAESLTSAATAAVTRPPLTATTQNVPGSHDGSSVFTFELRFSETPKSDFSYRILRDHAFTVTGGEVVKARRLEPGKNVRWEITVEPSGNGDVTVSLPATTDCDSQGAICTSDNRMLSESVELTVDGPGA